MKYKKCCTSFYVAKSFIILKNVIVRFVFPDRFHMTSLDL